MTVTLVPVVDISHAQGKTNFVKMRNAGVKGVIIRVSNGTMIDDLFETYWKDARSAGYEETDLATYTFINPKRGTPQQAASVTVNEIHRVVGHTHVGYMLDAEQYINEFPNPGLAPVYGPAMAAHLRAHLATARAGGVRDFAYSNRSYWNGPVGNGAEWVGDDQLASELDFIVARYPAYSNAAYARLGYPGSPDTWQEWAYRAQPQGPLPPRGGKWVGWQIAGGWDRQGANYGVTSLDLDLNIVHPDHWAWWTGKTHPAPPHPQPSGDDDMEIRLFILSDSDAQFLVQCTSDGRGLVGIWADGSEKMQASVAEHRAAAAAINPITDRPNQAVFEQAADTAGMRNIRLLGRLPVGDSRHTWTGAEVLGFDADAASVADQIARLDGLVAALNDATGRNGQEIHEVKTGLIKAGGG